MYLLLSCMCLLYILDLRILLVFLLWIVFHQHRAMRKLAFLAEGSYPERTKSIMSSFLFPYKNGEA